MKFSESWLREWVNPNWDTTTLSESLSLAGLEVDEVSAVAPAFSGVVVGQVVSFEKHPDADKLNVTQVDIGLPELVQIVCGAKNVVAGMKVCCATVGANLPGDFKIKKAKLRGVPSNGMLCGASELGLPDDGVDGLHVLPETAPLGMDVRTYLNLDDQVIEVSLTPNRADCFSVLGIARDVAAISDMPLHQPFENQTVTKTGASTKQVQVMATEACPKYLGCVVTGFDLNAQTPKWMQQRVERSGLATKSLIVDITNYVMLELGQPMHAFDLDKISGNVTVRLANPGEQLTTLDEKQLTLKDDTLVIADDAGVLALAGVMGGLNSAVSATTQSVFFECAHFSPLAMAGKARAYGLHTDASLRFERGVDAFLPEIALERALSLLTEIAGGKVSELVRVVDETLLPCPKPIVLRPERITKLLGVQVAPEQVVSIFQSLNCGVVTLADGWRLQAPSYRFDMMIEADLIEEVGRIYGYNNLPETPLDAPLRLPSIPEAEQELYQLKQALVQNGFYEVVTYSFVDDTKQQAITPEWQSICLQNPISDDMKAMRTTLFPGLLQSLSYNQKRQQSRIRFFESGLVFQVVADQTQQIPMIGGIMVGANAGEGWHTEARAVDFYDMKGQVETLLEMSHLNHKVAYVPANLAALHPGQSALIQLEGQTIGVMGQLHPSLAKTFGVSGKVYLFELQLAALSLRQVPKASKLSKFPEVQRDLAFVVASDLPAQTLVSAVSSVDNTLLKSVEVFDVYQGEGLADGLKSIALTLRLQHDERTLQDDEVAALMQQIIELAHQQVNAVLR